MQKKVKQKKVWKQIKKDRKSARTAADHRSNVQKIDNYIKTFIDVKTRTPHDVLAKEAAKWDKQKPIPVSFKYASEAIPRFDPKQRAKEKAESRARDAADLASGKKTPEQLRIENGSFAFGRDKIKLTFPKNEGLKTKAQLIAELSAEEDKEREATVESGRRMKMSPLEVYGLKIGDMVKMSALCKWQLLANNCHEHVAEFGDSIGVIREYVKWPNSGSVGPEVEVYWDDDILHYAYHPSQLVKINKR